jgi:alpha-1,2-mannosyltransferase
MTEINKAQTIADDWLGRASRANAPDGLRFLRSGQFLKHPWLHLCPFLALMLFALNVLIHQNPSAPTIPLGSDFSEVWAAGILVLDGQPEKPFDPESHFAKQRQLFGDNTALFGWCYPPYFLAIAAMLATLPYLSALCIWQAITFALYLSTLICILRQRQLIIAVVLFPAVLVNLVHGQNGFLSATLLGAALQILDRRAIAAGILFGLMAYKPQFCLMIPVALVAGGHWRTLLSAAVTIAAMTAATLKIFGPQTWLAFRDSLEWTRTVVLEQGSTGFYKLESIFAAARLYGAPVPLAYAAQAFVTLTVASFVCIIWRRQTDLRLKSSALVLATLLTTPYCLDYDLMVLAPAIAFMYSYGHEKGFKSYELSVLAVCWIMPLCSRLASFYLNFPIGVLSMIALFALVIYRATRFTSDGTWALATRRAATPG